MHIFVDTLVNSQNHCSAGDMRIGTGHFQEMRSQFREVGIFAGVLCNGLLICGGGSSVNNNTHSTARNLADSVCGSRAQGRPRRAVCKHASKRESTLASVMSSCIVRVVLIFHLLCLSTQLLFVRGFGGGE